MRLAPVAWVRERFVENAPACHRRPASGWRGNLNPGQSEIASSACRLLALTFIFSLPAAVLSYTLLHQSGINYWRAVTPAVQSTALEQRWDV